MTTDLLFPSTTLTAFLVLVSIKLCTILPLSLVIVHGLVMINLDHSILVTDSTLVDQSQEVSDLRKSNQMLHLGA
ncbi:hypothetical protein A2U01_0072651 [Trifolium medium]|uniref:Uncharacterized protein n=1 Tax=Trifolium medium TaxID=97028 RepID=A0A392SSL8_9FABA|nr:hypothetical protein [Trifolium medium]